jgi:hypothetical protein
MYVLYTTVRSMYGGISVLMSEVFLSNLSPIKEARECMYIELVIWQKERIRVWSQAAATVKPDCGFPYSVRTVGYFPGRPSLPECRRGKRGTIIRTFVPQSMRVT